MTQSSILGLARRATILKYNGDGTVQVALDEIGLQQTKQEFKVSIPASWSGPNGEFIGGWPTKGASVYIQQAQGGQWFIQSTIPNRSFNNTILKPGRAVISTKNSKHLFIDPNLGIQAGDDNQYIHIDPELNIFSHNFNTSMEFTEASRKINGIVKRDIKENSTRGILGNTLDSHLYDKNLTAIAFDNSSTISSKTIADSIRNPPLIEQREITYEFAYSFNIGSDLEEASKISDYTIASLSPEKKDSRADVLSLSLQYPNHLIETIKGNVVDSAGNILDLNRNILPIGKIDNLSLKKADNKSDILTQIKAELRKSLAYHFEINTKKPGKLNDDGKEIPMAVPDTDDISNYSRNRSKFFIDVDKEGQFKIQIPSSSESGNIPLLTRYENYSNLLNKIDGITNPNALVKNTENQDIFLDSFSVVNGIKLKATDSVLDGYAAPIDRITDSPITLNTMYHNILKMCDNFLPGATKMNLYEDNSILHLDSYEKLISDTITTSGKNANGGGRSGTINSEGMLTFNIGANTIDKQSLWIDCAGSIMSQIGRDKNGISCATSLDGDLIIQLNSTGIDNTLDSRFKDLSNAPRTGTIDIRVMTDNRPSTIVRIDKSGVKIATEGRTEISSNQDLVLSSQANMHLNAERIIFYTNTKIPRLVERNGEPI